ncbi:MAG: sensor histidine kinase [Rhodospirillales bacterium]
MRAAPPPENEDERLRLLRAYRILDTPPEEAFDRVTRMVTHLLRVPISLVSLVDAERQWFKSKQGLRADETPRELAFCAHAILGDEPMIVENATEDERFADNPLVAGNPDIRFYAGAPLTTPDGLKLGTLCAIDTKPRKLTIAEAQLLDDLGRIVINQMELRLALLEAQDHEARENLLAAQQDAFIGSVSHELRSPLTSIKGSLDLLNHGAAGDLPDKARSMIQVAARSAGNLLGLVDDLLDASKLDAGEMTFDFQTGDLAQLVREAAEELASLAAQKSVTLTVTGCNALVSWDFDAKRLRQAVVNLLSNAIKFSPADETVTVTLDASKSEARITIADRGPGIPADFQPRMFQRFAQADNARGHKGTGLGLTIAKAVILAHRGSIGFETAAGDGTTFAITLPPRASFATAPGL